MGYIRQRAGTAHHQLLSALDPLVQFSSMEESGASIPGFDE